MKKPLKTSRNNDSVEEFLNNIEDDEKKKYSYTLLQMMKDITKVEPEMWGKSIIGFGSYHYIYESGREGDWFLTGFSPRKQNMTIYIMAGFNRYSELMEKLGKYKTGKSCLYIKKLENIDISILKELISSSVNHLKEKYPAKKI